eukprot:1157930-Pelagomonas_calceolata.AAC.1
MHERHAVPCNDTVFKGEHHRVRLLYSPLNRLVRDLLRKEGRLHGSLQYCRLVFSFCEGSLYLLHECMWRMRDTRQRGVDKII